MSIREIAVISGASSGIGAEFARQLAAKGYDLILVARRKERLSALATCLEQEYAIRTEVLVADLSNPDAVERVQQRIVQLKHLTMLVNNAGFGTSGNFTEIELGLQIAMVQVHILASMQFCRAALPGMVAKGRGAIINVSSIAGLIPMPGNVTYCATKAYLNSFSEALQVELDGTGVQVQALCPGFTYTEFHGSPEFKGQSYTRIPKILWMTAEEVVTASLNALKRDRVIYIPGLGYRLIATVIHLTPTVLRQWVMAHGRQLRRMLRING